MEIVSAIMGAVLVVAVSYSGIYFYDLNSHLGVRKKGNAICSISVWLTEGATFLAVLLIGMKKSPQWNLQTVLLHYILICAMSMLTVIDYKQHCIPNIFIKLLLLLWAGITGIFIIIQTETGLALLFLSLSGGIVGGLIFLLCYIISGKQLGAGDVKLAFIMGIYLTGQRIIGAVLYGVILCCIYSIIQLLRKKIGLKTGVPLAPFLYMGVLTTLLIF